MSNKRVWMRWASEGEQGQGTYRSRGEDAAAAEGLGLEAGHARVEVGRALGTSVLVPEITKLGRGNGKHAFRFHRTAEHAWVGM